MRWQILLLFLTPAKTLKPLAIASSTRKLPTKPLLPVISILLLIRFWQGVFVDAVGLVFNSVKFFSRGHHVLIAFENP